MILSILNIYCMRQNFRGGKLSWLQEKTPFAGKVLRSSCKCHHLIRIMNKCHQRLFDWLSCSIDEVSSFAPLMHLVLTLALKGSSGSSKEDFFALKEQCVPVKKAKESGISYFSGNSIDRLQGWCSVGVSLTLILKWRLQTVISL